MYFFHQIFVPSEIQRHSYIHTPIFSALLNLTFLTLKTQKFKFDKFLPRALSTTQNEPKEPKRSQINPHFDHETAVHILLEEAAYRCFDLAHTDLAHLSPNRATHLKWPKNEKVLRGKRGCILEVNVARNARIAHSMYCSTHCMHQIARFGCKHTSTLLCTQFETAVANDILHSQWAWERDWFLQLLPQQQDM